MGFCLKVKKQYLVPGAGLVLAACLAMQPAWSQPITERTKQKQAAEKERAALQKKLSDLQRDMNKTEAAKDSAADELAKSEQAISKSDRALRGLKAEQQQTEQKLGALIQEQVVLSRQIEAQQAKLSRILRQHYIAGNEDRIKLLLSGDNPNRITRELQYMGYVSQAQAELISELRTNLDAVRRNREETQNAKYELEEIAQEQQEQKQLLEKEKARRHTLLAELSSKLKAQRKEVGNLQRNEQRLSGLVDKLASMIVQQQREEAEARARRAREKQQAARAQAARPPAGKEEKPAPATSYGRNEVVPSADDGHAGRQFAALKGKLKLPLRGEMLARFGATRDAGPSWKGLFIGAPEGAEVRAVAAGKVVYADWLRGFGNLVIIDHGGQYMTIYGYNQSVLKNAGDTVNTGDVIASAGSSGGMERSGLYFEMRHEGRPFDPMGWVTTR